MVAKSLRHKFVSAVADGTDTTLVRPQTNWNDDHNLWLGNRATTSTSDTIADTDHLATINYNSSSPVAVTLPQPTGSTFLVGWMVHLINQGSANVTITPTTATINAKASIVLVPGMSAAIFSDGTNYSAMVVPADVPSTGAGRLTYVSATQIKFAPYNGQWVKVGGVWRQIPSAAITAGNTGVYVNTSPGQNLLANQVYYVYLFDNAGTPTIDYSGSGYVYDTAAGNIGVAVKTADNTRSLIGFVATNASAQFADSSANRQVSSWFNRVSKVSMGASSSGASSTSTSWAEISSSCRVYYISFVDEEVLVTLSGAAAHGTANGGLYLSFGLDGSQIGPASLVTSSAAGQWIGASAVGRFGASESAVHYFTPFCLLTTAGTASFYVWCTALIRG